MKITIAAIGKNRSVSLTKLIQEYSKRLPWKINWVEQEAIPSANTKTQKEKESEALCTKISDRSLRIVLDTKGTPVSSKEFATLLEKWQTRGASHLTFLIGGAEGLSPKLVTSADYVLSLSNMTWPHMLVRLMLIEQIYRAYTILKQHPYHRE